MEVGIEQFSLEIIRKVHPLYIGANLIGFSGKDRLLEVFNEFSTGIENGSSIFQQFYLEVEEVENSRVNFTSANKSKESKARNEPDEEESQNLPQDSRKWKKPKLDSNFPKEKKHREPETEHFEDSIAEKLFQDSDEPCNSNSMISKSKENSKIVYSCLYSKLSMRKNKKWEEDGYLFVADGLHLTLKDQEGKVVTTSNNYKFAEDVNGSHLDNGIILKMSNKEILIGDIIKEPKFY